jgi:hypothetical protein
MGTYDQWLSREPDYGDDHLATPSEAVAEWGRNYGADHPDQAWMLHDWDVWVRNPHYTGPPVRHPEDDPEAEGEEPAGFDSLRQPEWTGFDAQERDAPEVGEIDDELPF